LYKVMMGLIFESVITSGYAAAGGIRLAPRISRLR
jgi:hypothetical protein